MNYFSNFGKIFLFFFVFIIEANAQTLSIPNRSAIQSMDDIRSLKPDSMSWQEFWGRVYQTFSQEDLSRYVRESNTRALVSALNSATPRTAAVVQANNVIIVNWITRRADGRCTILSSEYRYRSEIDRILSAANAAHVSVQRVNQNFTIPIYSGERDRDIRVFDRQNADAMASYLRSCHSQEQPRVILPTRPAERPRPVVRHVVRPPQPHQEPVQVGLPPAMQPPSLELYLRCFHELSAGGAIGAGFDVTTSNAGRPMVLIPVHRNGPRGFYIYRGNKAYFAPYPWNRLIARNARDSVEVELHFPGEGGRGNRLTLERDGAQSQFDPTGVDPLVIVTDENHDLRQINLVETEDLPIRPMTTIRNGALDRLSTFGGNRASIPTCSQINDPMLQGAITQRFENSTTGNTGLQSTQDSNRSTGATSAQ